MFGGKLTKTKEVWEVLCKPTTSYAHLKYSFKYILLLSFSVNRGFFGEGWQPQFPVGIHQDLEWSKELCWSSKQWELVFF